VPRSPESAHVGRTHHGASSATDGTHCMIRAPLSPDACARSARRCRIPKGCPGSSDSLAGSTSSLRHARESRGGSAREPVPSIRLLGSRVARQGAPRRSTRPRSQSGRKRRTYFGEPVEIRKPLLAIGDRSRGGPPDSGAARALARGRHAKDDRSRTPPRLAHSRWDTASLHRLRMQNGHSDSVQSRFPSSAQRAADSRQVTSMTG
jgi:hypothetical protein